MKLDIVQFDEEALRQDTYEIELPPSIEIQDLAYNMIETMTDADGVGLAAPQVGRAERVFVAATSKGNLVFINPRIVRTSDAEGTKTEMCLSLPGVSVRVRRPKIVWIDYYDETGQHHSKKFKRMDARIIQHEYDHLQGVLITDYLKR